MPPAGVVEVGHGLGGQLHVTETAHVGVTVPKALLGLGRDPSRQLQAVLVAIHLEAGSQLLLVVLALVVRLGHEARVEASLANVALDDRAQGHDGGGQRSVPLLHPDLLPLLELHVAVGGLVRVSVHLVLDLFEKIQSRRHPAFSVRVESSSFGPRRFLREQIQKPGLDLLLMF